MIFLKDASFQMELEP